MFDNDFPAFSSQPFAEDAHLAAAIDPLLRAEPTSGACRVVCFSTRATI